eukprot:PhF_6_TR9626/c0_g1_i1/m.14870
MAFCVRDVPRECIAHTFTFCDAITTSNAYLVCRSWYHAVDRYACLADKIYDFPIQWEIQRHLRRWFPSASLTRFQDNSRQFQRTEVFYLEMSDHTVPVTDWPKYLNLCPALRGVIVKVSPKTANVNLRPLEEISALTELDLTGTKISDVSSLRGCRALRKLDLSNCGTLTDAGIRGLEAIPTLEELILHTTKISDVSHLSGCGTLRKLNAACCWYLITAGIQGLEAIPTLSDLILSSTKVSDVSHLSGCRALRTLSLSCCGNLTDAGIR